MKLVIAVALAAVVLVAAVVSCDNAADKAVLAAAYDAACVASDAFEADCDALDASFAISTGGKMDYDIRLAARKAHLAAAEVYGSEGKAARDANLHGADLAAALDAALEKYKVALDAILAAYAADVSFAALAAAYQGGN